LGGWPDKKKVDEKEEEEKKTYLLLPFQKLDVAALDRYWSVLVSTLTFSPALTKRGTCTTAPVSSVAGLDPPLTVLPFTPGSVEVTSSSTVVGGSTEMTLPFQVTSWTSVPSLRYLAQLLRGREREERAKEERERERRERGRRGKREEREGEKGGERRESE
jgi:hypothetical protein